ncbi:MAG: SNF2-related protein, partial [Betaproteobacteria bacterium]
MLGNGLWFDPRSLQRQVDDPTWSRGLVLYRNQQVLSLDIEPGFGGWVLLGEVQGSQREPYELSVELKLTQGGQLVYWDSDCSCPVGHQCKHGVALTLKAAYQGLRLLDGETGVVPAAAPTPEQVEAARQAELARKAELARLEAEAQLLGWLQALDRAKTGKSYVGVADRPGAAKPAQYLYLLTVMNAHGPTPLLLFEAMTATPKLSGGWGKPKRITSPPYEGLAVMDAASATDHDIFRLLRAQPNGSNSYSTYSFSASVLPTSQAGQMLLQMAASTGRLFTNNGSGAPDAALQWGPPRALAWHWQETPGPQGGEPAWSLRARLAGADNGARLCLNNPPLYLDGAQGVCGPVQADGLNDSALAVLLKSPPLKAAALKKHQAELMQRLGTLPLPPVLEAVSTLRDIRPRACLQLSRNSPDIAKHRGLIQAQLRFDYAGHCGWWAGQGSTVMVENAQGRFLLTRDTEAEFEAITLLYELGLQSADGGLFGIPGDLSQQRWLDWADADFAPLREAGFELLLADDLTHWVTRADSLMVALQPQGEDAGTSPWFDLSLGMEINGQRHNILPWLPGLIAQAAHSPPDPTTGAPTLPPFMYLPQPGGDGFVRLPTDGLKPWLQALLELVGERGHDFSGDSLKLSRLDALRTAVGLGEGAVWASAQSLQALAQCLSGHAELPDVPVPPSLQAELRPYQQQGLNWLQFLRTHSLGGILADDMGLGKTLQTLAHIQIEKDAGRLSEPALIIAPVSLLGNWQREAARFCPQLRCLVLHGKERHEAADQLHSVDLVIAPYSVLQRDRDRWLQAYWHLVVLDEAQNIKNASSQAAQVASQLQTRHRLCLSGTPMENHLGELWSLFHFLMPGFLGSQTRFKTLFRTPIEKQGDPERLQQLRARITPFMLRRTKALVAHELPPKVETVMRVELSGKQADLYETIRLGMEKTVREALARQGLAKSQIMILDALLKLRQVCCDPRLLPLTAAAKVKTSAKLEQLMTLLPEMLAEGRRILLFSQFTSMLTLIEAELKQRQIPWVKLTGQSQKRDAVIEQFTSGQVPLFLISLKAGGVGLNLPQADTVIHYDPWWNPAAETQATDRAHRIGQTQSVWVLKLVAQGTIEERILALQ